MSEILVASTSTDEPVYGPVARILEDRGFDVLIYQADRVFSGADCFSMVTSEEDGLVFSYNGNIVDLPLISSAWYRRPNLFLPGNDKAKQLSIEYEVNRLQDAIWQLVPSESWLNSPANMDNARIKLGQLAAAASLGFNIPKTVVSNDWGAISENLSDDIIVKMARGELYSDEKMSLLYTTRIDLEKRKQLQEMSPFPGIFQNYANKAKEWRLTVVGDKVFDVAIYTDEEAKDDWRKHQFTKKISFKKEQLDSETCERAIEFLRLFGLRFGAFDFVEDNEGKITFLECNPNGQYMWLEQELDLPISDAIATELGKIASAA